LDGELSRLRWGTARPDRLACRTKRDWDGWNACDGQARESEFSKREHVMNSAIADFWVNWDRIGKRGAFRIDFRGNRMRWSGEKRKSWRT
jgi:hypothetical protein